MKSTDCLILALMLISFVSNFAFAQVKTKIFSEVIPATFVKHKIGAKIINLHASKAFEDLKNRRVDSEKVNQFAISFPVNIDLLAESYRKQENGKDIFSASIAAEGALNISVEFSEFELSEGDVLSIFTHRELTDSIVLNQNNPNGIWATRVYQGDTLTFVLSSTSKNANTKLVIGKVNFGYKPIGVDFGNIGASANCHINVNCPEGNGWDNEKNSVAMIVANGEEQCTGALIMNACGTNVPYFLTANHCLQAGNVPNWVFQFQTWSTTCNGNNGWREDIQFNGCVLRANSPNTDFALLQLNQIPSASSGICYSGWSRQLVIC